MEMEYIEYLKMNRIGKNEFGLSMEVAFHELDQDLQHVMTLSELYSPIRPLQMDKRHKRRN